MRPQVAFAGRSLLDSGTPAQEASQYYNKSTDSHNASEVPWLQTVGMPNISTPTANLQYLQTMLSFVG